jgi:hypothetical protein
LWLIYWSSAQYGAILAARFACVLIRFWNYASADRAVDLSPAGVPQQMLKQYHFCGKSSNILQPSMPPEGMVQVHVWDRKLSKVRAYSV